MNGRACTSSAITFTAVLVVLLMLAPASEALAVPVTDGLVGYWAGEGNADDSSGFEHHGTLLGDATFAPGRFGQAFQFDGSGDAMRANGDALPTGASDRTIAFWVQSDDYAVANDFLAGWGGTANNEMSALILGWFSNRDRKPTFWGYNNDFQATATLTDGQWHHLAFTLDGASAAFFIDGTQAGSGTVAGLDTPAGTQFRLADSLGPMSNFQGRFDEVAVYDRALTPAEVGVLAVPEPASMVLVGLGVSCLLRRQRRRRSGCA